MSSININPLAGSNNRVVVKPADTEEKSAGGIIIPDSAKEKPQKGHVMAVSEKDDKGVAPVVKNGDTVLYGKYAGTEVNLDGETYMIMRESDILAIVN